MEMKEYKKDEHVWTPAGTDVTERWRKYYGWVPPSELAEYQRKWAYYQELPLRKLDEDRKSTRLNSSHT